MFTSLKRVQTAVAAEEGQGLAEYAVMILVVALPVLASVSMYGGLVTQLYTTIVGTWQQLV